MSAKEWDIYSCFLHTTAVAHTEASNGLQDITEAACKRWMTCQPKDLQAAGNIRAKPPPMPLPSRGNHCSDWVLCDTLLPAPTHIL